VAETVRINTPKIDKIIANVTKVFRKALSSIQIFKNMAPILTLQTNRAGQINGAPERATVGRLRIANSRRDFNAERLRIVKTPNSASSW